MIAILLLLAGAAFSFNLASQSRFEGGAAQLALVAMIFQVAVALAAFARLPGAWVATVAWLVVQVLVLVVAGLVVFVLGVLPWQGGGPLVGHEFNPVLLVGLVVGAVAVAVVYRFAFRSALTLSSHTARVGFSRPPQHDDSDRG